MKIIAAIPVEKTHPTPATTSFRAEEMEVEIVRLHRYPADRTRERFYYQADVKRPDRLHPDAPSFGIKEGTYRIAISRARNPKWKPPQFPAGVYSMDIA